MNGNLSESSDRAEAATGRRRGRWAAALVAAWLVLQGAGAFALEATDPVAGRPDLAYLDLLRLIVRDVAIDPKTKAAIGRDVVPLHHIEGKDADVPINDGVGLDELSSAVVRDDGRTRLALLADLGPSTESVAHVQALALFDVSGTPRLLDVVGVGTDRFTTLQGKPLPLGERSDLLLIESEHSNSSETMASTAMIFVEGGRFRLIDTIGTYGVAVFGAAKTQEPFFGTALRPGHPYADIQVRVEARVTPSDQDCGDEGRPKAELTMYGTHYRWVDRRRRFEATSNDLKRLAAQNDAEIGR